ncbi:putative phospholipase D/Transphosphatidylase, PX domain superfamily [Septoria linicola]|nr:putative phospholipase D/Transphosphatidylase, PX domain superfamily [Septoria linicola]
MAEAVMMQEEREGQQSPKTTLNGKLSSGKNTTSNGMADTLPFRRGNETRDTVVNGKTLPKAPNGPLRLDIDSSPPPASTQPNIQFVPPSPGGFPFAAPPGEAGPAPTTRELLPSPIVNGQVDGVSNAVGKRRVGVPGTATPPERRSVSFARGVNEEGVMPVTKSSTWEAESGEDNDQLGKGRQNSLMLKLKSFAHASSTHQRTPTNSSGTGIATPNALSPQSERSEPLYPIPSEEVEATADADVEEDDTDDTERPAGSRPRQKRKRKRPVMANAESAPTTPRASRFASFVREHMRDSSTNAAGITRRGTLTDVEDAGEEHDDTNRAGVSEDEGRDRVRSAWRRGIEGARGLSYAARKEREGDASEPKRPSNLRRLTGFGAGALEGNGSPFRSRADRHNSTSAQKWHQIKAGLRMLGQRKKDERAKVDHQKSAQLMAELIAGAPAALIFASMFQRDEHKHRKVPVLLEQLKISIPEVQSRTDKKGDRDYIYRVDLEYGSGAARMKWTIYRSVNDFVNLHVKYKSQIATDKIVHLNRADSKLAKIPRFPKSVIPYARGMRGLFDKIQDEDLEPEGTGADTPRVATSQLGDEPRAPASVLGEIPEQEATTPGAKPRPKGHKRRQSSFAPPRRSSTSEIGNTSADPDLLNAHQKQIYAEKSRQKLETYLQQMIRWLIFRPDSTRLCKFLELSAMAIRLAAENGYQGKQGLLQIASRRHRDFHRKTIQTFGPQAFKERHKRRWFLIRHSYIVCVDGPESLVPYDVFLVDSDFAIDQQRQRILDQKSAQQMAKVAQEIATPTKKAHLIQLFNSERKFKLYARNEKQYLQFRDSLTHMMEQTPWSKKQRFASFAPVRNNVWARWLVDGRDHMWQVSRAIDNAKDFVYIHDWWLSPELYLRRPAAISQKWRLDRLLQRKAQEGVKIFVIVYRNIESAIPIDSEYTKWSLLDLHPNICVQRSPHQFRQNQFFWAHHEKIVVVDNMMAFVGGVDLCFGRWDDPCHSLTDDKLTGFEAEFNDTRDSEHCQVWPGKDYSNPRVQDFYNLDRPYEEMYDRSRVPRMPWHDIAMQLVGQPARDVGRHFVQRWNFVLRSRVATRPTPVLMPPPEYEQEELEHLGMTGTCQVQILRSCGPWSIGTPGKTEHSIMNAYCSLIKNSDHFVYVENQFFITSCRVEATTIHNKIGDALVERAIRAHEKGEKWQACLVIPLMPGFQNSVDAQDGTSVRLIMQCQFRSICRGETSIFGRLRAAGVDPEEYIRFYSLRQWGKIGPRKCLTTEQLYIHAKCMIVDDRSVIIGSANINERSMLGNRDSEVASIVTDTCMIPSTMAGQPYEVGEFAHTLRKRLMREHLGIDVDAIYRREQAAAHREEQDAEMERIYRDDYATPSREDMYFETPPQTPPAHAIHAHNLDQTLGGFAGVGGYAPANDASGTSAASDNSSDIVKDPTGRKGPERDLDVDGHGADNMKKLVEGGDYALRDTFVDVHGREVLVKKDAPDVARIKDEEEEERKRQRSFSRERKERLPARPPWPTNRTETAQLGLPTRSQLPELPVSDDTDIGGPPLRQDISQTSGGKRFTNHLMNSIRQPDVTEDCMTDPLSEQFYHEVWHKLADNNTKIYRQVFRCMPDSEVLDWKAYEKFNAYNEAFMQSQGLGSSKPPRKEGAPDKSGPPGAGGEMLDQVQTATSKGSSGLGALVDKLRPGSKGTSSSTHTEDANEKNHRRGSAGSPESIISSVPTAVPSPNPTPLDEKDAAKHNDHVGPRDEVDNPGRNTLEVPEPMPPLDPEKAAAAQNDEGSNRQRTIQYVDKEKINNASETTATQSQTSTQAGLLHTASKKGRKRGATKSSGRTVTEEVMSKEEAEDMLNLIQGRLVLWPYDWLEKEERGGNWLYNIDQLAPLEIYD